MDTLTRTADNAWTVTADGHEYAVKDCGNYWSVVRNGGSRVRSTRSGFKMFATVPDMESHYKALRGFALMLASLDAPVATAGRHTLRTPRAAGSPAALLRCASGVWC